MAVRRQNSDSYLNGDATRDRKQRCLNMVRNQAAGTHAESERSGCVLDGGDDSSSVTGAVAALGRRPGGWRRQIEAEMGEERLRSSIQRFGMRRWSCVVGRQWGERERMQNDLLVKSKSIS